MQAAQSPDRIIVTRQNGRTRLQVLLSVNGPFQDPCKSCNFMESFTASSDSFGNSHASGCDRAMTAIHPRMLLKSIIISMLFCQTGKKLIILICERLKEKMSDCLAAFVQVCGPPAFPPLLPPFFASGKQKKRIGKLKTQEVQGKIW